MGGSRRTTSIARAIVFAAAFATVFAVAPRFAGADSHIAATLSANHLQRDGQITVSAGGYKAASVVDLLLEDSIHRSATADAGGNVTYTLKGCEQLTTTAPIRCASARSDGTYPLQLQGIDGSDQARIAHGVFTVISCPPSQSQPPECTSAGGLARTGYSGILIAIGLGLLLVAAGALLVLMRRRLGTAGAFNVTVAAGVGLALLSALVSVSPARAQAAPGSISGKVTADGSGANIADVCVHAAQGSNFGSAKTAADGTYTISNLPPTSYRVTFVHCTAAPAFRTENYNDKPTFQQDAVTVQPGQAVTGINAGLAPGGLISGRITDKSSGAPIASTCVLLGTTGDDLEFCTARSGASGAFGSDVLATGTYIVGYLENEGTHAFQYLGGTNDSGSSTKLVLAGGDAKSIGIGLPAGSTISGVVSDAATGGPPRNYVCIYDRGADLRTLASGFIFSTTSGNFSVKQLPPGTHKLEFTDCGFGGGAKYITEFFDDKASLATADPIAITQGQDRPNTNAALLREGDTPGSTSSTSTSTTTTTVAGQATSTTTTTAVSNTGTTTTTTTATGTGTQSTGTAALSTSNAVPGGTMTASGGGFRPGSPVSGFVLSTPIQVAQGTADANGNVVFTFRVPTALAAGAHSVELRGVDPAGRARVVSAPFTVAGTSGSFGVTGGDAGGIAALGAAFLFAGAVITSQTRRRRVPVGLYPER